MQIVITGHKGFIGTALLKQMPDELKQFVTGADKKDGLDILKINTKVPSNIDYIIHLSAQAGVPESFQNPTNDAMQNIIGTLKMIELANTNNARLIFTTSGASIDPESPYGLSKKTAEEYIKMLCKNYVILRLSSVYGEKPKGVVDNFIRDSICTIYGDGDAVRDFVHVDDVAKGILKAMYWEPNKTYSLGSGKGTTVKKLARATKKTIKYKPPRKGDKENVVLENDTPDWKPEIDVIQYISDICQ